MARINRFLYTQRLSNIFRVYHEQGSNHVVFSSVRDGVLVQSFARIVFCIVDTCWGAFHCLRDRALSTRRWARILLQFYLLRTMTVPFLLITPTQSLSTHLIWHTYCALSQHWLWSFPFWTISPTITQLYCGLTHFCLHCLLIDLVCAPDPLVYKPYCTNCIL